MGLVNRVRSIAAPSTTPAVFVTVALAAKGGEMWVTLGRLEDAGGSDDARLERTTSAIADGAARMPGHVVTRLLATPDRGEFYCVTIWRLEASDCTYARVLNEDPNALGSGFGAEVLSLVHLEEVASYPPTVRP